MPISFVLRKVTSNPMALGGLSTPSCSVAAPSLPPDTHTLAFLVSSSPSPWNCFWASPVIRFLSTDSIALLWKTSLPFLCKSVSQAGYFYSANVTIIHPGTKMSNPGFSPPFSSPSVPPCFLLALSWNRFKGLLIPPFKHSPVLFPTHCLPYFWPPQPDNYCKPLREVFSSPALYQSPSYNLTSSPPPMLEKEAWPYS